MVRSFEAPPRELSGGHPTMTLVPNSLSISTRLLCIKGSLYCDDGDLLIMSLFTNFDLATPDLPSEENITRLGEALGTPSMPMWYIDRLLFEWRGEQVKRPW
ncbi:hypothetical protein DAEQUDRAFT_394501 [Daedalea quercina L-15889]|uniref:Uncharacterized protein n=1 Tax=Daedalea quercina L-15889 TaxID=1314783 RepID=A0A165NX01_9APHY|nr:hypothetical protein DAEQUDRAFT_394501 [Daedalea quercina L-15889]